MNPTKSLSKSFAHLSVGDQNPPHDRNTTPSLAQVSSERDLYIDHDHELLDAKLQKHFIAFRKFKEQPDLHALLFYLTSADKRLVTLTEDEAEELLTGQPSIKQVLQDAWEKGSFKEVRRLSEVFIVTQPPFVHLIIIKGVLWPVETRRWFSALW